MMGPFLEYDCSVCGVAVKENAPRDAGRLVDRIAELNQAAGYRVCAGCDGQRQVPDVAPVHTRRTRSSEQLKSK
jgi:hypothetical protein